MVSQLGRIKPSGSLDQVLSGCTIVVSKRGHESFPRHSFYQESELRASWRSWEGDYIPDILHACEVHEHALEAETEAGVWGRAVLAELEIPPVGLLVKIVRAYFVEENVVALLA